MLRHIIQFIAPANCVICAAEQAYVCDACAARHLASKVPACFSCNRLTSHGQACSACVRKASLRGVHVLWRLDGAVKTLVYRLKYDNDRALADFMAQRLADRFDIAAYDLVTFVASDGKALRRRGYNQAQLLARAVARHSTLTCQPTLLRVQHQSQTTLSRRRRLEAVQSNFVCHKPKLVAGSRILIIDDVLTTGATLNECARMLKLAGAKQVWGLVVAKK